MEGRTLTIVDTQGTMQEINLEEFGKACITMGRIIPGRLSDPDISFTDQNGKVVSREHGRFILERDRTYYCDTNNTNGTWIGIGANEEHHKNDRENVELFDKTILRIGSMDNPDKMVLILFNNQAEGERWHRVELTSNISIGRSSECEISLNTPGVSRTHCKIRRSGNGFVLSDMGSVNGTLLNGFPVNGNVSLKDKDVIQILDIQLLFSGNCIYYQKLTKGISLRVSHVNKIVGRGQKKKQILHDVNCEIQPNDFVAIIGGSGAGKTTLMNAISGFEPDFKGNVYCNGVDLVAQFRHLKNIIGFVPQQDIIYENLTLRKMLYYTAKMKMPKDTTKEEISRRIDEVLAMVDLQKHQKTYIRKLSGGQKKRASIAVELLADPKLFFLDEPTSGLDPGTEKNLMITLNKLSKEQNKTIIMVTHTTQNLHLCDKVIFMGPGGRLCFCGNVNAAKKFYQTDDLVNIYNMIAEDPEYWESEFADHQGRKSVRKKKEKAKTDLGKPPKVNAFRQFSILTQRYTELMLNDRWKLLILFLQPLAIAVLLYMVAGEGLFEEYSPTRSIMFALSCSGIWIGLFNTIQEICKERTIIKREYMANLKLPGYILSKYVFQTILGLVQAIILTIVFLLLVGADHEGIFFDPFHFELVVTVWLTIMTSASMGFVISAVAKSGDKAMVAAPFVLIIQLLFSGILFELDGAAKYISYITTSKWSVGALGSSAGLDKMTVLYGEIDEVFQSTSEHLLQLWGILLGMIVILLILSMILLRGVAKDRR